MPRTWAGADRRRVFLDYPLGDGAVPSFASADHPTLTFVLSWAEQIAALPQMKAAWIACFGPEPALAEAMKRLEVIADTFLSMNAPIQCAAAAWLRESGNLREQIRRRTSGNLAALIRPSRLRPWFRDCGSIPGGTPCCVFPPSPGTRRFPCGCYWNAEFAVHAGRFFGFPGSGWLVVSL